MSMFDDIFGSDRERNRMFWNITTTTLVDTVYACPKCKKNIGLEKRFIEPGMKFECPYCKAVVTVPPKEKEEGDGSNE